MSKLLTAKHWQLFLITFALPFISYIIGFVAFIIGMIRFGYTHRYDPDPQPDFAYFIPLIIGGVIAMACGIVHIIWIYQSATKLQDFLHPEMRKLKVKRFKFFFFSPIVYAILVMIFMAVSIPVMISNMNPNGNGVMPGWFIFMFIFMILGNFYATFCGIYILYFTAKTIKSAEMQREAHFSDYIGEFFMIWFYPVGVWFLQPKINKIVGRQQKPLARNIRNVVDDNEF